MMPSPTELHYFLMVSDALNLSRAAERLGVSQPTLSLAIQRLENLCGTTLLIRAKSGVKLTRSGQKLAIQARILLNDWEKVRGEALQDEEEVRGRYTIGCHTSVAIFSLPHFLTSVMEEHRGLEIKLAHDLSRRITEDVISFKIDFGIVVNPWNHPDLVIKHLWKDEVTFWTAQKPSSLQDPYSGEGVLICDIDLAQSQTLLKQMSKHQMKFRRVISSSSLEVVASLVEARAGIRDSSRACRAQCSQA